MWLIVEEAKCRLKPAASDNRNIAKARPALYLLLQDFKKRFVNQADIWWWVRFDDGVDGGSRRLEHWFLIVDLPKQKNSYKPGQ